MIKRLISFLLAATMVLMLVACNKGDGQTTTPETAGEAVNNESSDSGENANAWWQQYTTEPTGTTKAQTTKKSLFGKKETTTKSTPTTTKKTESKTTTKKTETEPYTKVDTVTMKYNVQDNSGNEGVVTLTKSGSNTYIKQTLEAVNATFETSYTAANAICYSSTLSGMTGLNIVFVFSSTAQSTSNLQLVVQFKEGNVVPFLAAQSNTGESAAYVFWPISSSGNEKYTEYLSTFKDGCEQAQSGSYGNGTNVYKAMLNDECVKEFMTW